MAYLRGDNYVWAGDDDRVHIWVADGEDDWAESGWACDTDGKRHPGLEQAAGVSVPQAVIDLYVVMRFAELVESGELAATIDRALREQPNFGSEALAERAEKIKAISD